MFHVELFADHCSDTSIFYNYQPITIKDGTPMRDHPIGCQRWSEGASITADAARVVMASSYPLSRLREGARG